MPAPDRNAVRRVLILGGTSEARTLAALAIDRFGPCVEVTTSLAGRTRAPAPLPGRQRVGGFGGPAGLADYLKTAHIDVLVDATHPFAATISAHARMAAENAGVKLLVLTRPEWRPGPGDRWIDVPDAPAAASALRPLGERVFLTFGGREIEAFRDLADKWFLIRRIDPPEARPPLARFALSLGRGPFSREDEVDLMRRHRIDVLVSKASGGAATQAKLEAARALGLPVVMIRRPGPPGGPSVDTPEAALRWLDAALLTNSRIDEPGAGPA